MNPSYKSLSIKLQKETNEQGKKGEVISEDKDILNFVPEQVAIAIRRKRLRKNFKREMRFSVWW
jgi:hypothetical protein